MVKFQVADINPLNSIRTAITRIPPGWDKAWNSAECMKLTDALNAYVIIGSYHVILDSYYESTHTYI